MNKEDASKILKDTRELYGRVADEFSLTRQSAWPELAELIEDVRLGERVLDLGCGNGRLLQFFQGKKINYIGVDNSTELLAIAKKNYPREKFILTDGLNLSLPDNYFDKIFCIAVLHHIPGSALRLKFLQEARRVLRPRGQIILSVWNLWQKTTSFWLLVKYTWLKLLGKSRLDFKDIFYPWGREKLPRYFHLFTSGELKKLFQKTGFLVKKSGLLKRHKKSYNIYIIAEK